MARARGGETETRLDPARDLAIGSVVEAQDPAIPGSRGRGRTRKSGPRRHLGYDPREPALKTATSRNTRSRGSWLGALEPAQVVASGLILVGAALRIRAFLSGRGLWLDEAMIAHNIIHRSFLELLGSLDYNQYAPIGWLWSVKTAVLLFGDGERGLRAVALVAGLSALPLTWIVARRYLPTAASLLALALVAFNWELIYYSSEVKPYGSDVLVALLALLFLSGPILDSEGETPSRSQMVGALGAAIVLQVSSFPAIFMLAGLGLSVFLKVLSGANRRAARLWCGVGAGWVTAFGALYVAFYRRGTSSDYLQGWRGVFVPLPGSATGSAWYAGTLELFASHVTGITPLSVACLTLLAGAAWLARNHPWRLLALVSVFPFLWSASLLRAYPMVNRLVLFTAPVLSLIAAAAVGWFIREWKQPLERITWTLLMVGILWGSFSLDIRRPWRGAAYGDPKPLFEDLAVMARPGDMIVTTGSALPPFLYYAPRLGLASFEHINAPRLGRPELALLREKLAGRQRVWFVVGHLPEDPIEARQAVDDLIERLVPVGALKGKDARHRSALLLFDMSAPTTPAVALSGVGTPQPTPRH